MIDHTNSLDGFRDGQHPDGVTMPDYGYDLNGNMTQDWNKGISEITYNHLNLPTRIIFNYDVNKKIDYLYNALGVKLKKVVDDKTVTPNVYQETHYLGGFQYVGDYLQFFPTAEGYVSVKESNYNYVYNYTDHLGNIRLSYTREGSVTKVLEENHYYPFGMKHSYNADIREWGLDRETGEVYAIVEEVDRSNYQYKYNGKEFQDELGLNFYDYGARNYDPAIGRWMNIDPLAEVSRRWSPYTYCYNNPIIFVDPDGMEVKYVRGEGQSRKEFRQMKREFKRENRQLMRDSKTHRDNFNQLKDSKNVHEISFTRGGGSTTERVGKIDRENGNGTKMTVDLNEAGDENEFVVAHETGHGVDFDNGTASPVDLPSASIFDDPKEVTKKSFDTNNANNEANERNASHIENVVRGEVSKSRRVIYSY